ncbi:hypothetical protein G6F36_014261 [Rhizopus arrhizus]|nr:hypothetical protein G6F36_014261 [Rhizopus arrhizus]
MKAAPGRRATIGETTKSYIRRQVIKGEFKTAKAVHQYLNGLGYTIGYSAALKLLKSMNFRAKIKAKKPLLTWTTDDWRRMVLSDETKAMFSGQTVANITGVAKEVSWYGVVSLTMDLETTLMDSLKYYGYNPEDIYFQQDKDPKHTSKLAKQWFVDNNFNSDHIYSWPAQSPDLNPIEHVWHHLKLKLSVYDTKAKGVHELWERIEKEWNTFTVDECRRYIDSMPDRCKAVIKAKGGHTRY